MDRDKPPMRPPIVTIGISPCWDIICRVEGISWGDHAKLASQQCLAAGKALNVSRALAWMGVPSVAAGLWGRDDYAMMNASLEELRPLIGVRLTAVPGHTRRNVTLIDTRHSREMHLRAPDTLATGQSLRTLADDLARLAPGAVCVFSGSLPEDDELLESILTIAADLRQRGARIVVDTSQKPLKRLLQLGDIQLIKPNLAELRQLLDAPVGDYPQEIVSAAKSISGIGTMLVSRGPQGAVVVRGKEAFSGVVCRPRPAVCTVGCGDWLLAGFLSADDQPLDLALERAVKAAAAKAWAWHETMKWNKAAAAIEVKVTAVE
jgi:1-phosphofructokinase